MRKIAKFLFFVIAIQAFLMVCVKINAQDFSNKGKEFWLVFPPHQSSGNPPSLASLSVYLTSDQNSSGKIEYNGVTQNFTVTANQTQEVILNRNSSYITFSEAATYSPVANQTKIVTNRGIKITVDPGKPAIVVYAHMFAGARSAASLILPVSVLGKKYYSLNFIQSSFAVQNGEPARSQFSVIATEANTAVKIQLRRNGNLFGAPITITLPSKGDVYQFQDSSDLSGTEIESVSSGANSCKKIAVFSGSSSLAIFTDPSATGCIGQTSLDPLYQQCYPANSWGNVYGIIPFKGKTRLNFRVVARENNTIVNINGTPVTLNSGEIYTGYSHTLTSNSLQPPFLIAADKPISVAQYSVTQSCDNGAGDPEMIILNPVEQSIRDITVFLSSKQAITEQSINIFIKNQGTAISSFRINGNLPVSPFIPIGTTGYSYLQEGFNISGNSSIRLTSDSNFNAICYGFGNFESFGYSAGTNVKDLYQFINTQNLLGIVPFPAACVNSPFYFSITFPYQPDSIRWNFNGLFAPLAISAPVADSVYVIAGRTVYRYRIPTPYTIATSGTYPIRVYARNPTGDGCTSEQDIDFDLQVFNPPTADFTWNSTGCVDSTIAITTSNTTGGRPIIKHFWDFGDGTFAYTNNPTKTYTTPGQYTIKYSVLTDVGCLSDTTKKTITVTRTPVAKFGFTNPQCLGKQVTFGDTSKLAGTFGNIISWKWNLGNGTVLNNSSGSNVSTTYPAAITYNATLQVVTNSGCASNIYSLPVKINPNPVPDFTNLYACLPDGVVNFTGTSTIADGTQNLFTYLWNFGEASSGPLNTALIKDPSHKYSSVGPFSVKLKVTSNNGCIDSVTKSVANIYPQPKSNFTLPAEVCWQAQVTFRDASNGITHPVDKWEWRYINSAGTVVGASNVKDPVFVFPLPGTYTVRHWVFTNQNCVSDTSEKTIVIHPWPTPANSLSTPLCEKNQATIFDNSTPNVGTNVRWYWNLGDGTIINATNNNPINHTYANWGDKLVKLVVENSKGCRSDTLRKTIRIHPLPKPGFILPEVCLRDAFAPFTDTSSMADGTASTLSYQWNFNAGPSPVVPGPVPLTSTSKNNNIRYNIAGIYQVFLKVTSLAGCVDSVTKPFTVNGVISKTDYTILPTNGLCSNQDIQIQNKTTVEFGWLTKVELFWDLANNPTVKETDDVPLVDEIYSHRYPNFQTPLTKTFDVRLRAYSGEICVSDIVKTITVNASPLTQFTPMPAICVDAPPRQITQARETGGLPLLSAVYTGPGVSPTGLFDPAVAGVGTHTIRYTFTAANGCTHFSEQTIEVWPRPVAGLNALTPLCEKNAITFNSNGSVSNALNLAAWSWNFGDGTPPVTVASNNPVTHTYAAYGTYNVNLTVINNRGCISLPQPLQVKVNALPRVDFSLPKVCLPAGTASFGDLSTIPDNTQGLFTYRWDFGDAAASPANSDTSLLKNPVYKYANLGPYTVQLKVKSNNGCIDSLQKQLVDVFPQPKARFTSKDSLCLGDGISFTDNSTGIVRDVTRWRWSFGNGDSSFIPNPSYLYRSAGLYNVKLIVYSSEGCISDTANKQVNVWAFPNVNAGPDIAMLEEGIRRITDATSTANVLRFLWSPPTYLDNTGLLNPTIIRPKDDIWYTFTVIGRGGCVSSDRVFVKVLKAPKPPNTFTPNGDGVNDFWEIKYLNDYPNCVVEVFNTAGTLVYRSVGYPTPWDGKWKGQALPAGTYYYVIDPKNGRARQSGYVTLLK